MVVSGGCGASLPGDSGGVVEVAEEEEVSIPPSSWGMKGARDSRTARVYTIGILKLFSFEQV